jgi:hypothetical protein
VAAEAEGQAATPAPEAPATEQAAQPDDKKKKVTPEQAEGQATEEAPATEQAAQPDNKKKKVTPEQAEGAATEEAPATEQAAQPDNKKKKVTPEQAEGAASDDMPVGSITKPDGQQPAAGEEPAAKKDKKAVPCDPATDSECVQQ